MMIRDATEADLPALLDIHNRAVRESDFIWIEKEDTADDRRAWFVARKKAGFPVLVAEEAGKVIGYGSYGTYRARDGYDLTVEHSVYLFPEAQGKGAGKALLEKLIGMARAQGLHAMIAVIDLENAISIRLHEKFGFVSAGALPQSGKKRGKWRDQVSMYLLLDDRTAPPKER